MDKAELIAIADRVEQLSYDLRDIAYGAGTYLEVIAADLREIADSLELKSFVDTDLADGEE